MALSKGDCAARAQRASCQPTPNVISFVATLCAVSESVTGNQTPGVSACNQDAASPAVRTVKFVSRTNFLPTRAPTSLPTRSAPLSKAYTDSVAYRLFLQPKFGFPTLSVLPLVALAVPCKGNAREAAPLHAKSVNHTARVTW